MQTDNSHGLLLYAALATMLVVGLAFLAIVFWINKRLNEENDRQLEAEQKQLLYQQSLSDGQNNGHLSPEEIKASFAHKNPDSSKPETMP